MLFQTVVRSLSTSVLGLEGVNPLVSPLSSSTSQTWDRIEDSQRKTAVSRRASQPPMTRSIVPLAGVNGHVMKNGITSKPGTINNSFLVEQEVRKVGLKIDRFVGWFVGWLVGWLVCLFVS